MGGRSSCLYFLPLLARGPPLWPELGAVFVVVQHVAEHTVWVKRSGNTRQNFRNPPRSQPSAAEVMQVDSVPVHDGAQKENTTRSSELGLLTETPFGPERSDWPSVVSRLRRLLECRGLLATPEVWLQGAQNWGDFTGASVGYTEPPSGAGWGPPPAPAPPALPPSASWGQHRLRGDPGFGGLAWGEQTWRLLGTFIWFKLGQLDPENISYKPNLL